jgi:hypothetical protein
MVFVWGPLNSKADLPFGLFGFRHWWRIEQAHDALDYLMGRFPFKTWSNDELMLPQQALDRLAAQGISFHVKGPATYEHFLPALRNPAATSV